ncbi:uncharacterized protein TNCV_899381 [Trichonephila clavipes]|nr:uncharacterized protein TNCV_899381 [Trichonephila clavipes]
MGLLGVRASDSRPEGLGSMPDANKYPPSTQSHGKIMEVEAGDVTIYRPFGELHQANSYCQLGKIIGRLECGRTQLEVSEEHGIAQSVISRLWQRFQDYRNVSRCYSTGRPRVTTTNEDRYIWQLLPKETDGAQHQTCLVSSLQLLVRQFQGRPCTDA